MPAAPGRLDAELPTAAAQVDERPTLRTESLESEADPLRPERKARLPRVGAGQPLLGVVVEVLLDVVADAAEASNGWACS
jgi:hypothetical protein